MVVNIFNGKIVYAVCSVACEINFISILIENITVITMRCKFKNICRSPIFITALLLFWYGGFFAMKTDALCSVRCKVPFADICGIIAVFIEIICHCFCAFGQWNTVPEATILRCILPCLQASTGRSANRLAGERIFKKSSFFTQFPNIRHYFTIKCVPTLLV